jgi:hypothetical protein
MLDAFGHQFDHYASAERTRKYLLWTLIITVAVIILLLFSATNGTSPVTLFKSPITVDEMAYSPSSKQVLAANNADTPAYGNLFATHLHWEWALANRSVRGSLILLKTEGR